MKIIMWILAAIIGLGILSAIVSAVVSLAIPIAIAVGIWYYLKKKKENG